MAAAGCLVLGASLLALRVSDDAAAGDAWARDVRPAADTELSPLSLVVASGVEEAELRFPAATVGPVLYPTLPVAVEATVEAMAAAPVVPADVPLTSEDMDALYAYVGVPSAWVDDLLAISFCESGFVDPVTKVHYWRPYVTGDGGASLGLHQLWSGWFREGEDPMDPVVNTLVAVRVREIRGRFGGAGGWTCADLAGIP